MESGYSRAQMGSQRAKEIKANINRLKSIEKRAGKEFERLKKSIQKYGGIDYSLRQATTYRENYVREMEKYSHLDNYDKLVALFNKLKNPKKFYEFMSKNEIAVDLTYQSDQYYTQQAFNSYLQELGIETETDSIS